MKKIFVYLSIIFTVCTISLCAQKIKDGFKIEIKENSCNRKSDTYYTDNNIKNNNYNSPKDKNDQSLGELIGITFHSIEKLNQIEMQIFNQDEIEYLSKGNSFASCLVSSSGKIVSVSFIFKGWDPNISTQKLAEYANRIKKEITYELTFKREVAKEGYIYQSFPVFKSLNLQKQ